ncbi:hypothetical protein G7Z17_g4444 [Cylindrodendrum hubeiense]|uniref:BZIP domain-containing protein n=1 Tax=Cylindrodendrum hubeiense TaxID=595255 RepID=A0A9P5H8T3_9HYPO|nr:hypothetical protein G7Z17_g4444 [Cylindrodendrum hubeiense]
MDAVLRYTVSSGSDTGLDASWADIKDPKEKKKVQNRIAQRSYRQRMKARLEKLQAKVNYHEQLNGDNSPRDEDLQNGQQQLPLPQLPLPQQQQPQQPQQDHHQQSPQHHHQHQQHSPQHHQHQLQGNQTPYHPVTLESMTPESPHEQPMQPQVLQSTFYDHGSEKGSKPIYMQRPLMDNAQQLPPTRSMLGERTDQNAKACDKLPMDYMGVPKQQMADKHQVTTPTDHSPQDENARMNGGVDRHQLFTPEANDVMGFNHPFDMWSFEMLPQTQRQHQPPALAGELPHMGGGDGSSSGLVMDSSMTDMSSVSPAPSAKQGLDERLEYVLSCTRAAGFESFDTLVTAYYNGNFDDSSPLAIEQRLSRNRGLPSVVADVFRDARRWSDWERRGFDEELLKTTERMLVSEGEDSRGSLEAILNLLSAPQNGEGAAASASQATLAMKKVMQNELPNLWTLMMAFSAEHKDVWQRNRSNTVLAAILLLRYPGRMPHDQLLKLEAKHVLPHLDYETLTDAGDTGNTLMSSATLAESTRSIGLGRD